MKENFIKFLEKSANLHLFVIVYVGIAGKEEIIINYPQNVKSKLDYYKVAYNDELCLNTKNDIKITRWSNCKNISEIATELEFWYKEDLSRSE
jgi:hypothetical protein